MAATFLWNTMLSVPLSALLSYALKKRYHCDKFACGAAFALGAYIALMFSLAGLTPTLIPHLNFSSILTRLTPLSRLQWGATPYLAVLHTLGNLFLMMPFALLTSLLFPEHRTLSRQLLLTLGLSLLIESLQVLLGRETDLCDLVLNAVGAATGYGLAKALDRRFPALCRRLEVRGTECMLYAYILSTLVLLLAIGAFRMAY